MEAVHSLDHFALCVPDANVGGDFYASFGLTANALGNALKLDAANGIAGVLYEGPKKRLHHLTFGINADALDAFRSRLEAAGITLLDPPREIEGSGEGLWFKDPYGNLIQLLVTQRRAPTTRSRMEMRRTPEGARSAPEGNERAKPRRLGHALLFTPDVLESVEFYKRFLGLRLADRSGDVVAFLYSPHGSDHHIVAFGKSEKPGFHHASFEVGSVDEIGIGAMAMQAKGHREGWGFGRHYIGSNFFHYVRDPWGSFAEYFCDIDYIPAGCAWQDRNVPAEHALYVWGPPPPPYFFENAEQD